eukprot:53544-Pleurochrysis_carterae.AAC.2
MSPGTCASGKAGREEGRRERKRGGRTDRQTDRQTDRPTDDWGGWGELAPAQPLTDCLLQARAQLRPGRGREGLSPS